MKTFRFLFWVGFGCAALSCSRSTSQKTANPATAKEPVVAFVNGQAITVAALEAEIARRTRGRGQPFLPAQERDAVLQEMIKQESVFAQARLEGFDQSPEITRQIHDLIVSRYLEAHLAERATPAGADAVEIQKYYDQHTAKFTTAEQVRFAVIKIGCSPKATEVKQREAFERAQEILRQARATAADKSSFASLARRFSEDQSTRYQGGDAGWISLAQSDRWERAVREAAFALAKPDDLSPVVTTPDAFYLIKMIGRKEASRRPLAEVREMIAYQVEVSKRQEAQARFYERLKSGQHIEINRTVLESLPSALQQTEAKPPSPPAG